jgi:hypothetical protein
MKMMIKSNTMRYSLLFSILYTGVSYPYESIFPSLDGTVQMIVEDMKSSSCTSYKDAIEEIKAFLEVLLENPFDHIPLSQEHIKRFPIVNGKKGLKDDKKYIDRVLLKIIERIELYYLGQFEEVSGHYKEYEAFTSDIVTKPFLPLEETSQRSRIIEDQAFRHFTLETYKEFVKKCVVELCQALLNEINTTNFTHK